jgi:hypothetical protein
MFKHLNTFPYGPKGNKYTVKRFQISRFVIFTRCCEVLIVKPERKRCLGRPRSGWEDLNPVDIHDTEPEYKDN